MKATLGYLLVGILLLAGGDAFRRVAVLEDALSAAHERLATQNPGGALVSEDAERSARWTASLPLVGPPIGADLRRLRALAAYWRADYSGAATESSGADLSSPQTDGPLLFIGANAMYRGLALQPRDNQAPGRGLDAVLKAYSSVLEADPTLVDAAFNYEFVSRLRGSLAAGRGTGPALPSQSNTNGDKGSPPNQTKPSDFNIIVPLRPEERQEQTNPQSGSAPQRKG